MVETFKRLDYLDLEVRPYNQIKTEQFSFPCFCKSPTEHLVHTESAPQLNFISDILLLLVHNHSHRVSPSISNRHLRDISDKLDYLKESRDLQYLRKLSAVSEKLLDIVARLDSHLLKVEETLEKVNEKLQCLV